MTGVAAPQCATTPLFELTISMIIVDLIIVDSREVSSVKAIFTISISLSVITADDPQKRQAINISHMNLNTLKAHNLISIIILNNYTERT